MNKLNIVFSTGAGISKESGIETFRGEEGTWNGIDIEKVATLEGFLRDPLSAYDFYENTFGELLKGKVMPNKAHIAIAEFEKNENYNVSVITQNVDDLHEKAGSKSVIHLHGDIQTCKCIETGKIYPISKIREKCSCCKDKNILRPNIIFFNEDPEKIYEAYDLIEEADFLFVIGTSGNVYPAASLPVHMKMQGKDKTKSVEFNIEKTGSFGIDETIIGKASETVPLFLKEFLEKEEMRNLK